MRKNKKNRHYKDSVFTDLFSSDKNAPERFLQLYNALFGTHLVDTAVLKNIRLEPLFG